MTRQRYLDSLTARIRNEVLDGPLHEPITGEEMEAIADMATEMFNEQIARAQHYAERERGEDDGLEYGHPRDAQDERGRL